MTEVIGPPWGGTKAIISSFAFDVVSVTVTLVPQPTKLPLSHQSAIAANPELVHNANNEMGIRRSITASPMLVLPAGALSGASAPNRPFGGRQFATGSFPGGALPALTIGIVVLRQLAALAVVRPKEARKSRPRHTATLAPAFSKRDRAFP